MIRALRYAVTTQVAAVALIKTRWTAQSLAQLPARQVLMAMVTRCQPGRMLISVEMPGLWTGH